MASSIVPAWIRQYGETRGLTGGVSLSSTQFAPPVLYGFGDTGGLWWAHEVTTASTSTWETLTPEIFLAGEDPTSPTARRASPAQLSGGILRMNDRLEMIVGTNTLVRNSRAYNLQGLMSDRWALFVAHDLNNSGVILAQAGRKILNSNGLENTWDEQYANREPVLLVPARFALRNQADLDDGGWDDTGPEPWTSVGAKFITSGNPNDRVKVTMPVPGIAHLFTLASIQIDRRLATYSVVPASSTYLYQMTENDENGEPTTYTVSPATSTTSTNSTNSDLIFSLRGKEPTDYADKDGAIVRFRNDIEKPVATLHVRVLPRRVVKVEVMFVHDSAETSSSFTMASDWADRVVAELNATYKRQANIHFVPGPLNGQWVNAPGAFSAASSFNSVIYPGTHTANTFQDYRGDTLNPQGQFLLFRNAGPSRDKVYAAGGQSAAANGKILRIYVVKNLRYMLLKDDDPYGVTRWRDGLALGATVPIPEERWKDPIGLDRVPCFIDSGADLPTYAHEVGHVLALHIKETTANITDTFSITDPVTGVTTQHTNTRTVSGHHDPGPWPAGFTSDEIGLMGVLTSSTSVPTRWLRQQDWDKANYVAGKLYHAP
jgi:hypothetical protein